MFRAHTDRELMCDRPVAKCSTCVTGPEGHSARKTHPFRAGGEVTSQKPCPFHVHAKLGGHNPPAPEIHCARKEGTVNC
eukprot:1054508-Pelagomonas_calceolata.AAC.3